MKRINATSVFLLCILIALLVAPIQGKKIKDLKYPPLSDFEIPQPDRVDLDNGMAVYLLEDHTLPKVNLSIVINRCGSYPDPPHLVGLAEITGSVMRIGGTTTMTGDRIDEELEGIGAYVESSINTVSGYVGANALSEYKEKIISVAADILRNPVFNEDKIELAKTERRTVISRRNDEPIQIAIREFLKLIYGSDSPYARHIEYATIEASTRDDMIMFHKTAVKPNYVQLAIWGDFDTDEILDLIKKYFADWPRSEMEIPPPPDFDYTFRPTINYAEKTDINQSSVIMGHIGGKIGDPDYPATIVMNSILGGGFGSRLFNNVRSRKSLAYSAQGQYIFRYDYPGFFYAYAATKSESTIEAIREIKKQIKSIQTDPATEEEMKQAKDGWLNSFVFKFDTKGEIIRRIMTYDYYGMPADYLQQLKNKVEKITPQDVLDVAQRKLNPENLQILVVGKAEDFDEPLSVFGEINEIDITIPGPAEEEFAATDEELALGLETLKKTVKACGGMANFKKVENTSASAKVTINMPQGAMTLDVTSIQVLPDKIAQFMKTPMGEQVMIFNGVAGWMSMAGQTQAMPAADLEDKKKEVDRDIIRLFAHADDPYFRVAHKGEEDFNGTSAIRLDFLTHTGVQFTIYINPEDYLPLGRRHMGQTMMGPGEIVETYTEFKKYGPIMQPARIMQDAGGLEMEIEIVKMEVNGEIDNSIFKKPEGI
jgi:zinc protease